MYNGKCELFELDFSLVRIYLEFLFLDTYLRLERIVGIFVFSWKFTEDKQMAVAEEGHDN